MEWISVKDKLPENDDDVLVYDYRDGIGLGCFEKKEVTGYFESDGSFFETNDGWDVNYSWARHMGPTHWMPLPKPPMD